MLHQGRESRFSLLSLERLEVLLPYEQPSWKSGGKKHDSETRPGHPHHHACRLISLVALSVINFLGAGLVGANAVSMGLMAASALFGEGMLL